MKASEFRLGNLVESQITITQRKANALFLYRITELKLLKAGVSNFHQPLNTTHLYYKDLQPIPLTEEWLLKFGFEKGNEQKRLGNGADYQPEDVYTIWVDYSLSRDVKYRKSTFCHKGNNDNEDCFIFYDNHLPKCQYVHQLQNLYFALTNTELNIR